MIDDNSSFWQTDSIGLNDAMLNARLSIDSYLLTVRLEEEHNLLLAETVKFRQN